MDKQIGFRSDMIKKVILSAGFMMLGLASALGVINAPAVRADYPDKGLDENRPVKVASREDKRAGSVESADTYISRGVSRLKKGQIEDAVSYFNRAIDLDPEKALAFVARGSAYYRLNQLDNALSDYNRAIGINPDIAAVYRDRGSIYQSRGRFDDAISDYSRALELNPENSVAYNLRGSAYFSQEQHQKAFADFNRAIELDPGNVDAYIYRGYYYQAMNEYSEAAADYRRALEQSPKRDVAERLRDEIDRMLKETESKNSRSKEDQKLECRWTMPMNTNIKRKECKTEAEWEKIEKLYQFRRDVIHGPNYSYFIDKL